MPDLWTCFSSDSLNADSVQGFWFFLSSSRLLAETGIFVVCPDNSFFIRWLTLGDGGIRVFGYEFFLFVVPIASELLIETAGLALLLLIGALTFPVEAGGVSIFPETSD